MRQPWRRPGLAGCRREDGGERGNIESTHQPEEREPTGRELASRALHEVDRADGDQPEDSRKPHGGDLAKLHGRGLPAGLGDGGAEARAQGKRDNGLELARWNVSGLLVGLPAARDEHDPG